MIEHGAVNLVRFVPRVAAEWELDNDGRRWCELDGSLVYVDISGFTALSEKLARRGKVGAEELTHVLNKVFGQMLEVAYAHGGSLLKFGGDALLLLFSGEDHPCQAASGAVEMQAALRAATEQRTSAGRLRLRMSVGVHSGPVHLFLVGDSHGELVLTGPAASMTTAMEETATAGQVLVSADTRRRLPSDASVKAVGRGHLLRWRKGRSPEIGWSPRRVHDAAVLDRLVPLGLRSHLKSTTAEPEHRIATVGFVKFSGTDRIMAEGGPTTVAEALDELVSAAQAAVDREQVTFLATDLDANGGKIILVAGVPTAREDDEGRMLRAVRELIDSELALGLRIGVNRGHVFAGEVGTSFRTTYTIMGDTVNLAARLMAAADTGQILVTADVLDRAHTLFETTPMPPFSVKGKQHPVSAFELGAETGDRIVDQAGELPFVGRDEERSLVTNSLAEQGSGQGRTLTIVGERGVGKSRLVDEALATLIDANLVTIRGEPYATETQYRAVRDALREAVGIERDEQYQMVRRLHSIVAEARADLIPFLPLVADAMMLDVEPTRESGSIEPRFRQARTAEVVVSLLQQVLPRSTVIFVEDAHWMDEASSHLLSRIEAAAADGHWAMITNRWPAPGGFVPAGTRLELQPLTPGDTAALVLAGTEAAPLRTHDVEAIVARTGGLPLFIEEILRGLRNARSIESLPESLDAVVSAQIDALDPLTRRLLRYASVLGHSFRRVVIDELLEAEDIELNESTRRQLAGFIDSDGSDRLRFRHAVLRDVAYEGLSFRRRQELHRRAGESIENLAGADTESVAHALSFHFFLGQDWKRAWLYGRLAGASAADAYANVEAASHYQRALDAARRLDVDAAERVGVLTALGDVQVQAGLFDAAIESYRRAERLADDDLGTVIEIVLKRSNVHRQSGAYVSALRETTRGRRMLESSDDRNAKIASCRLLVERSAVRRWQQRAEEALRLAEEAEREARIVEDRLSLGRALDLIDWAHRMLGQTDEAVHYDEALAIFEELEDLSAIAQILNNLGADAFWQGRWGDAIDAYRRSREAELRTGNDVQAAISAANIAELLINQHRLDEAEPLLADARRVLQASNHAPAAIFAESEFVRLLIRRGDLDDADRLLDDIDLRSSRAGEPMSVLNAMLQRADIRIRQGRPNDALDIVDEAVSGRAGIAQVFGPTIARLRSCCFALIGDMKAATDEIQTGVEQARSQGLLYDLALLLAVDNDLASLAGREVDPDELAEKNRLFAEMDLPTETFFADSPAHL